MIKPKLSLSFVKSIKPPKPETTTEETVHVDVAQTVRETTQMLAKYVGIGLVGWVVLDTARQCAIKVTPQH